MFPSHRLPSSTLSLNANQIHLWLVDVKTVETAGLLKDYALLISEDDTQRMQTMRSPARQRQFLIARAALRSILCMYMPHYTPSSLKFAKNDYGKPVLATPSVGLMFNVSHSHNKVLIGITRQRELGVDIEFIDHGRDVQKIAAHYFHPNEWNSDGRFGIAQTGNDAAACFYKLWTLKEAYIKAEGRGFSIPIDSFYFEHTDTSHPQLINHSPHVSIDRQWRFFHHFLSENYSLAIAFEQTNALAATELIARHYVPLANVPVTEYFTQHLKEEV